MVYIVPKKDQYGQNFALKIPHMGTMEVLLRKDFDRESIGKTSITMLYTIARILNLEGITLDEFYEEMKKNIQFE